MQFLNVDNTTTKPKATIHVTGKLGFNMEAAKLMAFDEETRYRVAVDDASNASRVYLVTASTSEKSVVKVAKAGQYYYINLAPIFRQIGMEYEKYIISFDVDKSEYEGNDMFVLTRRRKKEKLRDGSDKKATKDD